MSNNVFNSFSTTSNKPRFYFNDLLDSDSLVLKIAFLLLVVFAFIVLLRLGVIIIGYIFKANQSPHLINGMVDATQMLIYQQDPSNNDSVTIYRSVNANNGIEFSWSVWIFINNLQYLEGQYRHIFHKGNGNLETSGLVFPNNAPGLYLAPNTNNLIVVMNTFNVINEEITITDIPLNKWVNVIIRCQESVLDVYINGTITRSLQLQGVPKQNYGNVFVAMNGGFDGYISNLWYYNYALGTAAIQNLIKKGPNTTMVGSDGSGMNDKTRDFLALRWYFAQ
jgi:hypothetical protein